MDTSNAGFSEARDRVMGLWQTLLGSTDFSSADNFFDIGGSSVLLSELRTRIEVELGHRFALTELFRHPTVDAIAKQLTNGGPLGRE